MTPFQTNCGGYLFYKEMNEKAEETNKNANVDRQGFTHICCRPAKVNGIYLRFTALGILPLTFKSPAGSK